MTVPYLIIRLMVFALAASLMVSAQIPGSRKKKDDQKKADAKADEKKDEVKPGTVAEAGPGAPVDPKSYKIGPEDVLMVRVWREAELTALYLVRPDGKITMPLIGDLTASGLTPEGLAQSITEGLGKIMVKPDVTVSVQQVNSKKYYITGEVNKTGQFPLVLPVTVLEALSQAGGLREFGNGKKIVILRGAQRLKFNYNEVIKGKNLQQNITLENGDHIIVP
jgi:polysaccharide export outer membrane protein